ncbi:hypothetical protein HAX54_038442, partial [Datura stramonium]|nr:hypothetical protein [Datura stramonium]
RVAGSEARTAASGHKKAEGWSFENSIGGYSGKSPIPLIGSRVELEVYGSGPATRRLVTGSLLAYSIFFLTSVSHRRFVDTSCDSSVPC